MTETESYAPTSVLSDGSGIKEKRTKFVETQALALWLACVSGHMGQAETLVNMGVDPATPLAELEGNTPLHGAAMYGRTEILNYLLRKMKSIDVGNGTDQIANLRNNNLQTPLHLVCATGKVETARALLEQGADTSAVDKNGDSPLHVACWAGSPLCVALLLQSGANINMRNNKLEAPDDLTGQRDYANASEERIMTINHMFRPTGYSGSIVVVYEPGAVVREGKELESQILGSIPFARMCYSFGSQVNSHGVERYLVTSFEEGLVGWVSDTIRNQKIAQPLGKEYLDCKACDACSVCSIS